MTSDAKSSGEESADEISVLIKALREVDQRLDELTEGQVDSVLDRQGRSFLLHRAQAENRYAEAARRAAILDALPAHVLLLNPAGKIVAINAAWCTLRSQCTLLDPSYEAGTDYLGLCEAAVGEGSRDAHDAAAGIRMVLTAKIPRFALEFHVLHEGHSSWYLLSVAPLNEGQPTGAVVMHLDITEQKRGETRSRRFAAAMDAIEDAIYVTDRTTMRFVHVNEAACRMQGRTRRQLMDMGPAAVLRVSSAELASLYDEMIVSGRSAAPVEYARSTADGRRIWIEMRRHAHRSSAGSTIITLIRDVTARKFAEQRIAYLNRVYAMLSGINALMVRTHTRGELLMAACRVAVDEGGFLLAVISTIEDTDGHLSTVGLYGKDENMTAALQRHLTAAMGVPDAVALLAITDMRAVVASHGRANYLESFSAAHPEFDIQSMAVFPLVIADQVVGLMSLYAHERQFFHAEEEKLLTQLADDIAFAIDHVVKQERLDYLAYYDSLTGLANRKLFLERVSQLLSPGGEHKLALVLIDLRRFKDINDTLGRAAGDILLKQVSQWLIDNVGEANRLARVGADQFSVAVPEAAMNQGPAGLLEGKMTAFLNHRFVLEGAPFRVTAAVGIAMYPEDGADADTLLSHAEAAMNKAKAGGRRYLFYNQKMSASLEGKLNLENQLHRALENDEFELHYQPKLNLVQGAVTGAEALIRWRDPKAGLILPNRFIPSLEETGLIHEVGRWALRSAIENYLQWKAAGFAPVRIAVNVSPLQLRSRSFATEIEEVLGGSADSAGGLELEITESLIMDDIKEHIKTLRTIRGMGVTVAIDDFGTGFSSLSYLAKLPVNTLKIDRSFITDMCLGREGLVLVSAIVKLAHSLGLKVVAEGVETEQQSRLLGLLKCDEIQGYFLSKPLTAAEFETRYLTRIN